MSGSLRVPSDKSLSHRAVLFSAMADGRSALEAVLDSADVRSTITAVVSLGARVSDLGDGAEGLRLAVDGWGASGPTPIRETIDCGNSGTTARLVLGICAGWPGLEVTLAGDSSLSRRPMTRVTDPLGLMGATFETAHGGRLPVTVRGSTLRPVDYATPIASAQVKTAILLAALRARGVTTVAEPAQSRDHTERLLPAFGVPVESGPRTASVRGPVVPRATAVNVPGDPSSAAFPAIAAALVPDSDVTLTGLCLNPTRTGFVRVMRRMGARVTESVERHEGTEPVGSLNVRHAERLKAATVTADEVPSLVDEVPILAVLATAAEGTTRFEGIGELRVKESDRLEAVHQGLKAMGASVRAGEDWLEVEGPALLRGAGLDSLGDHRLAMSFAVAALVSEGVVTVSRFEAVEVSYPRFLDDMRRLGAPWQP